ncbi:MAG: hypothetical protein QW215_00035 [Ignisphaera sp.]
MIEMNDDWFTGDDEEFCRRVCDELFGLPKHVLLEQGLVDYCGCEDEYEDYGFEDEYYEDGYDDEYVED